MQLEVKITRVKKMSKGREEEKPNIRLALRELKKRVEIFGLGRDDESRFTFRIIV